MGRYYVAIKQNMYRIKVGKTDQCKIFVGKDDVDFAIMRTTGLNLKIEIKGFK